MKGIARETASTAVGTFFLALGVNVFLTPNKISTGGITSVGTVLLYLFDIRLSVTNFFLNAVLFFVGYRRLGKYAVAKTVSGILFLSFFLEITAHFPPYTSDITISTLVGGAFMGLGVGLAVRVGASTGGSDFAALILKGAFRHISLANIILIIDTAVIAVAGIVFRSFEITAYSIFALYISSRVTDRVLSLGNAAKAVRIFSDRSEEIAEEIIGEMNRGVSGIYCRGMYSKEEGVMLMCILHGKEIPALIRLVHKTDRRAFIVIDDVHEVLGEGFSER